MALEVAVEGDAVGEKIADAVGAFVGNEVGDRFVDRSGAGGDGVGGVLVGAVAFADGRGNAALGPHTRRAFAERSRGDDGHRQRRQLQGREQPSETGADDDDVAGGGFRFSRQETGSVSFRPRGHVVALPGRERLRS